VRRRNLITLFLILAVTGLCLTSLVINDFKVPVIGERDGMRLGLDLKGGTHLVYEVDLSNIGDEDPDAVIEGVMNIIERRVDAYGVAEPVIQRQGAYRISVQLPGIRDMEAAVKLVGQTAQLDFRKLTTESEEAVKAIMSQGIFPDYEALTEQDVIEWTPATAINSAGEIVSLTGKYLERNTAVVLDQTTNKPMVSFEFGSEGARLFEQITRELSQILITVGGDPVYKPLGIFLDDQYISSPQVRGTISDKGVIENMPLDEAQDLTILLNEGALPVPLNGPIIREDVDPTLGRDSINKSLLAGGIGLFLVLVFMVLYYRLPGTIAAATLVIYAILVLAAFKLIPVTLTLAGVAGFILSIGMAVDANVLIFERMKEELRSGRTLGGAIEMGFNRAWSAIRDSNISTLITCGILYWMGSMLGEPKVMGFAATLSIGVLLSMFTALVITRSFLRLFVGTRLGKRHSLFGIRTFETTIAPKEQE